uniref:PPUP7141 n=2 Tax=Poeciliopsis prolifica TaxID=188132 RepID=A0A0S7EZ27_9TELE
MAFCSCIVNSSDCIKISISSPAVEKDNKGKDIKGGSGRGSLTDIPVPSIKKPENPGSMPNAEPAGNSLTPTTTEPTPTDGQPSSCLEIPLPPDGPLQDIGAGVSVIEHNSPHDTHPEESDRERRKPRWVSTEKTAETRFRPQYLFTYDADRECNSHKQTHFKLSFVFLLRCNTNWLSM